MFANPFVYCFDVSLSKIIAIRFYDSFGGVSVSEFLEFFDASPQDRAAKASASAVKLSLRSIMMEGENMVFDFENQTAPDGNDVSTVM